MPQDHRKQRKCINIAFQVELTCYLQQDTPYECLKSQKHIKLSQPLDLDSEFFESVAKKKKKKKN